MSFRASDYENFIAAESPTQARFFRQLQVDGQKLDERQMQQFSAWATYFRSSSAEDQARAVQSSVDAQILRALGDHQVDFLTA